ncbi:Translocation protein S62 [Basidiobolus ranarum]|uniref:Translocation protein SEC62 n=1 Tax=Basidiobolus ranarum TaxID=34480 RepID=A0ABR2W2M8_9FUNG
MTSQDVPKECLKVADYLMNSRQSGLEAKEGIMNERRVKYFKGSDACGSILGASYVHKTRPKVASREEAENVLQSLLDYGLIAKCQKDGNHLMMIPLRNFKEGDYYVWLYEGSQLRTVLGAVGLVALVLFFVMFPLWPAFMRDGAWYVSIFAISLLGLLMGISVIRLIFYITTYVVCKPGIWIFPNLFEDVGFFESFVPLWGWDVTVSKKGKEPMSTKKIQKEMKEEEANEEVELSEEDAMKIFRLLEPSLADLDMTLEELLECIDDESIMDRVEANASNVFERDTGASSSDYIMEDDGDENYIDEDTDDLEEEYDSDMEGYGGQPRVSTGLYDIDE